MNDIENYLSSNPSDDIAKDLLNIIPHFEGIYNSTNRTFKELHGSFLFDGKQYKYLISEIERQKLLYQIAKKNNSCLEIGTNIGHSSLIMLIANPNISITTIDIEPQLSKLATDYLKKNFPNSKINLINASSPEILKKINNKFDFFLLDGDHTHFAVFREFKQILKMSKDTKVIRVLFDDLDMVPIMKKSMKILKINDFKEANCPGGYSSYYEINTEKKIINSMRFIVFNFYNTIFNSFSYFKHFLKIILGEKKKIALKEILKNLKLIKN